MSKSRSIIKRMTDWKVVICIQVIATLILIGFIFKLGALPLLYAIAIIVVIVLLIVGTFFLMKPSNDEEIGKTKNVVGKCLSILLSVLMLVGSMYIAQGDSAISAITGANTETTRISVVVKKDSPYKKISDLKDMTIETNTTIDTEKISKAIEALKKEESSIQTKEISDLSKLSNNLYDGKTKAILVNESWNAMLELNHENFQEETKEIWSFEIIEEIDSFSKNVNVTKDPFIVYISGIDTNGPVSTVSRSDVNMMVTVNPKTKQILMTSIPRDYYVPLANKNNKPDKLTHSGNAGIENTVKTVENFMGVDINYYARVNFTSLIKMVDALGGIDIDSDVAFTAYDGTKFKKGTNHINGDQALAYSRERKSLGGGDNARVHHQQIVLTAMLKKMMSPAIITNYSSVLKSIEGSFETNMAASDITDLLQMQISDMASWTFIQKQLEETGKEMTGGAYMPNSKLWYGIPVEASVIENKQAIKSVLSGNPVK